ncbi:MAG TPA: S41 family peptidase [Pyrinomonadaceae bacterium]|nr:S41 family peptidase [Pyrinomonadaceae bacterium]
MSKKVAFIIILFIAVSAVVGGLFGKFSKTAADTTVTPEKISIDYREALDVIDKNYVGEVKHEQLSEKSIQSMLWTLDPHSAFFSADEYRKLNEEQASEFTGIGVSILQHRDGVYVQSIIPNTPADKAGLRYGDRFISVDDKDAKEWTSSEVSKNVRGPQGTTVNVKVERAGVSKPVEFNIVRGGVPLPSIRNSFMLGDGVGYIGLVGGFQGTTSDELDTAINDLKKKGMKSLVLDLRNNPGGLLQQAIKVVSRFVPEDKTAVSVKGRTRGGKMTDLPTDGGSINDLPLVVMINGGSASASEIVAGAIQDYDRGVIVGTDSFGKGLVQRVFDLPFGTGMTLTTARYYTPYGRSLQRDYSNGSIYEYYTHGGNEDGGDATTDSKPIPAGSPVTTANGRVLYGGRGIEPDIKAPAQKFSPLLGRLNEAAFFFVRQLVSGQIKGFENYTRGKQTFASTIEPGDLAVNDKLFEAFRNFAAADKANGLTAENINSQIDYAKSRVREELATANYSTEAGSQVLLEVDPQLMKAVESITEAKKLTAVK